MQQPVCADALVVDDDPRSRELMRIVLEVEGYRARLAGDGVEALEMLRARLPDVVLLDLRMPGMDGLEFCRRARAIAGAAVVPIVVLSGLADQATRASVAASGASAFLAKPLDRRALRECLAELRCKGAGNASID